MKTFKVQLLIVILILSVFIITFYFNYRGLKSYKFNSELINIITEFKSHNANKLHCNNEDFVKFFNENIQSENYPYIFKKRYLFRKIFLKANDGIIEFWLNGDSSLGKDTIFFADMNIADFTLKKNVLLYYYYEDSPCQLRQISVFCNGKLINNEDINRFTHNIRRKILLNIEDIIPSRDNCAHISVRQDSIVIQFDQRNDSLISRNRVIEEITSELYEVFEDSTNSYDFYFRY